MKIGKFVLIIIIIMLTMVFACPLQSFSTSRKKNPPVYCCMKGKIKRIQLAECLKHRGTAHQTLSEARQRCSGKVQKQINKQIKTNGITVNSRTIPGKNLKHLRPDLVLVSMRYRVKRSGKSKQAQWIEVKVRNNGPAHIGISGHPPIQVAARSLHAASITFSSDRPITNLRAGLSQIVKIILPEPVKKREAWTVKVDSKNVILETNEANNSVTTMIGEKAGPDFPASHKKKQVPIISVGKFKGTSPKRNGAGNVPKSVPKSLGSGIVIVSPTSADTIYMGRPMNVRFRFTRDVEAGEVAVYIKNKDTGAIVFTMSTSYHTSRSAVYNQPHKTKGEMRDRRPLQEVELTLPGDLDTENPYVVTVNKPRSGVYGVSDIFYVRDFSIGSALNMTAVEVKQESLSIEPGYGSYQPGEEVIVRIHSKKTLNYIYLSRSDTTMGFWPCLWRYEDGHQEYNIETGDHIVRVQLPDEDTGDQRWAVKAFLGESDSLTSHRFVIADSMGARWPAAWEILIPSPLMSVTAGQKNVPFSWRLAGDFPEDRRESSDFRVILLKGDSMRVDLPRESIRRQHGYRFEWDVPDDLPTGDDYRMQVIETNSGITATSTEFSVYSTMSIRYDTTSVKVFDNTLQIFLERGGREGQLDLYLIDQHGETIFRIGSVRRSASQYNWLIGSRFSGIRSQNYPAGYDTEIFRGRFAIRVVRPRHIDQWAQGGFFTISRPYLIVSADGSRCGRTRGKTVHWESNLDDSHLAHIDYILYNYYPDRRVRQRAVRYNAAQPVNGSYCFPFTNIFLFRNRREDISSALIVYIDLKMRNTPRSHIVSGTSPAFEIPWRSFKKHVQGMNGGGKLD